MLKNCKTKRKNLDFSDLQNWLNKQSTPDKLLKGQTFKTLTKTIGLTLLLIYLNVFKVLFRAFRPIRSLYAATYPSSSMLAPPSE